MNKDIANGNLKQVKGSVKEALGKVMGDDGLEAEGATEKSAGKAQEKTGKNRKNSEEGPKKLHK